MASGSFVSNLEASCSNASLSGERQSLADTSDQYVIERDEVINASSRASSGSSRATGLQLTHKPFGFEAKTSYDATENLLRSRSEAFLLKPPPHDNDIWKRPPPNFVPQGFMPKPPKRNSRAAVKPWEYKESGRLYIITRDEPPDPEELEQRKLPQILRPHRPKTPPLKTRFKIPDPFEARMTYIKERKNIEEPFDDPKPHDFRQYPPLKSLGLPQFETEYVKDPYNINFLSQRLNVIKGSLHLGSTRNAPGVQMGDDVLKQPPKWELDNYLDKLPWPIREYRYTRHRPIGRTPHSAFMSRVEDTLNVKWAKEKMEKAIEQQELKSAR